MLLSNEILIEDSNMFIGFITITGWLISYHMLMDVIKDTGGGTETYENIVCDLMSPLSFCDMSDHERIFSNSNFDSTLR